MEDALYEIASMRLFARLSLDSALPDRTTIMNFRHLLELHIPVENEHLFRFKMNADSGLRVHRFPAFFKVVVVFYAARRSFSGLSATILTGVQFLVLPDQRSGCWHRAAS